MAWPGIRTAVTELELQCANHYTTEPHKSNDVPARDKGQVGQATQLPRLTQPPALREMVEWLITINGDGECSTRAGSLGGYVAEADRLGPKVDGCVVLCSIHQMNRVNSRNGSPTNAVICITVIIDINRKLIMCKNTTQNSVNPLRLIIFGGPWNFVPWTFGNWWQVLWSYRITDAFHKTSVYLHLTYDRKIQLQLQHEHCSSQQHTANSILYSVQ